MKLEIGNFTVDRFSVGDGGTRLEDGVLHVDENDVKQLVLADGHFSEVRLHPVYPGDSTRIIHAMDTVEPRHKVSGPGTVFPGTLGPPTTVGEGRTHRLSGMALITVGEPVLGESTYWREAIIDMSGPGAGYSCYSRTANLVMELLPAALKETDSAYVENLGTVWGSAYSRDYNQAVRTAGFKVSDYLAGVTSALEPESIDTYELTDADPSLPTVVYASQNAMMVYGTSTGWQPTFMHPNELLDGALHHGFNGPASIRDGTYGYQNDPVVKELYARHGKDLNFYGLLLFPMGGERLDEKERITSYAVKLLQMVGADGIVESWVGGGHPGIDSMLLAQKCEQAGIAVSLLNPEMAPTQEDTGFVHFVPEADAIVSLGNYERKISLPPVDKVIGGTHIFESGEDASGSCEVTIRHMYAATSTVGLSNIAGVQY